MKWILRTLTLLCSCIGAIMLSGCGSDEPTPPSETSRTVLVYIIATNNLGTDRADYDDLEEMSTAAASGALGNGRWLVYHAPADGSSPRLIEITDQGENTLATYEAGSSATSGRMNRVLDDMVEFAPANSYGLVLWSHATGWLQDGIEEESVKPRSFGSDSGQRMNITTLRSVLENRGIDYLYVDACYMATVEVAYELRNAVKYIVASASELPRDGMPYNLNVAPLIGGSSTDLIKAATNTFDSYNTKSDQELRTCTMSVIETSALDQLASATAAIYKLTPLPHPGENVTNYRGTARQGYSIDFGEYVSALASDTRLDESLITTFNAAMDKAVIYKAATEKLWDIWPIYNHSGLSTYVFNNERDFNIKGYNTLEWFDNVVSHHIHD